MDFFKFKSVVTVLLVDYLIVVKDIHCAPTAAEINCIESINTYYGLGFSCYPSVLNYAKYGLLYLRLHDEQTVLNLSDDETIFGIIPNDPTKYYMRLIPHLSFDGEIVSPPTYCSQYYSPELFKVCSVEIQLEFKFPVPYSMLEIVHLLYKNFDIIHESECNVRAKRFAQDYMNYVVKKLKVIDLIDEAGNTEMPTPSDHCAETYPYVSDIDDDD